MDKDSQPHLMVEPSRTNPFEIESQNALVLGQVEDALREYKKDLDEYQSRSVQAEDDYAPTPPSLDSLLRRFQGSKLDYPKLYRSIIELIERFGIHEHLLGLVARMAISRADEFDLSSVEASEVVGYALDNGFIESALMRPDILRRLSKQDRDKLFAKMLEQFEPKSERQDAALKVVSNVFPLMLTGSAWPWKISPENVVRLQEIYRPYLARLLRAALLSEEWRPELDKMQKLAALIEDEKEREAILREISGSSTPG